LVVLDSVSDLASHPEVTHRGVSRFLRDLPVPLTDFDRVTGSMTPDGMVVVELERVS
jgi:hypothetical protein